MELTHDQLARVLLDAVRAQQFERADLRSQGGATTRPMPGIDLALIAFPPRARPVWANVLFSREHPQGLAGEIGSDAGALRNLRSGGVQPAGLAALMFGTGIARCVDQRRYAWDERFAHDGRRMSVGQCFDEMLSQGDARATAALVALLHRCGAISPTHNALEAAFELYGLNTLRADGTTPDGGWESAAGLRMTAWDTARLLWLMDTEAPRPPWLPAGLAPPLSLASATRLRAALEGQALHRVLSSAALAGEPGWVSGLPAQLPARWIDEQGALRVGELSFAPDVRPASAAATLRFAHLTGSGEQLAADAGIVRGLDARKRTHYIVALITTLGTSEAPGGACVAPWKLAALGRTIDAALAPAFVAAQA